MSEKQKTIQNPVTIKGAGLHTGLEVLLTFKPAPENHGYKFKRTDLEGQPTIDVDVDYVSETSRGTTLSQNGAEVLTVEHPLAALVGLGIDNVLIEVNCCETPILDGSSKFYVEALLQAGIVEQEAERVYYELNTNISFSNPEKKVEIIAMPCDTYKVSAMIDYDSEVLTNQFASIVDFSTFKDEIAPSRTFVFLHELEFLIENNLVKGGDINNAIVFVDRLISQPELEKLAAFFNRKIDVLRQGILNNVDLYHNNEPARHKLLDLIGDLALLGRPLKANIIATRPGHKSNIELAKLLKKHFKDEKQSIPVYDPNKPPLMDINEIKSILPHRHPFLFVDKIIEMTEDSIVGIKNVAINEPFFAGHFPDEPVMPGVLLIETMAQVGGIHAATSLPDPKSYNTYFVKIDNVKFRQKVVPGDTVIFKLNLVNPIRRGLCHMKGVAYVGNKVVMEGEMLAQLVKNK